jgi:homoserine kinase
LWDENRMTHMASRPEAETFVITTPATSANLGPGFDCLALALAVENTLVVTRCAPETPLQIAVEGEGAGELAVDARNLIVVAMRLFAEHVDRVLPPFRLTLSNRIPLGRGLGSSAAAIISGLLAAEALLGVEVGPMALLRWGLSLESHPDNLSACLFGGLTIAVLDGTTPVVQRIDVPEDLRGVVLVPELFSSTLQARAVLPATLARSDAVFNAGRTALLVAGMTTRQYAVLRVAMQDRLHQPQRCQTFPYLDAVIDAALAAGALGAALSGAGSSVLALTAGHEAEIAAAMLRVVQTGGLQARTLQVNVAHTGAACRRLAV